MVGSHWLSRDPTMPTKSAGHGSKPLIVVIWYLPWRIEGPLSRVCPEVRQFTRSTSSEHLLGSSPRCTSSEHLLRFANWLESPLRLLYQHRHQHHDTATATPPCQPITSPNAVIKFSICLVVLRYCPCTVAIISSTRVVARCIVAVRWIS